MVDQKPKEFESTTDQGNAFRDTVASFLEAAGYVVETEKNCGGKNVDIILVDNRQLGPVQVAIECKAWSRNLTRDDIVKIHSDHSALIDDNLIGEIWVVVQKDFAPAAKAFADKKERFGAFTFHELQRITVNFNRYLQSLVDDIQIDKIEDYYIRSRTEDDNDFIRLVENWLPRENTNPIAVLAGYGMGKSSCARILAANFATQYQTDPTGRVPILIRLGEIASEQSLEGLLGKLLTTRNNVNGYSFEAFEKLNRLGRFLILLDGFDEMKHTLTFEEFRHNFEQLNRLAVRNSKIILFGRPSAFSSEKEHSWALRGEQKIDGMILNIPGAPVYDEIKLSLFSLNESFQFLHKFYKFSGVLDKYAIPNRDKFVQSRIEEIRSFEYEDIITRPVQAKMLAEIAADPTFQLKQMNRHQLFQVFFELLVQREAGKSDRRAYSDEKRMHFQTDTAVWAWKENKTAGFLAEEIPDEIVKAYAISESYELAATRTGLIVGSLLESKSSNILYFPHRSFWEFLVASWLLKDENGYDRLLRNSRILTSEILDFVIEGDKENTAVKCLRELDQFEGELSFELCVWLARICTKNLFENEPVKGFWQSLVRLISPEYSPGTDLDQIEATKNLTLAAWKDHDIGQQNACIMMLLVILSDPDCPSKQAAASNLIALICYQVDFKQINEDIRRKMPVMLGKDAGAGYAAILRDCMELTKATTGDLELTFNLSKIWREMEKILYPRVVIIEGDEIVADIQETVRLQAVYNFLPEEREGPTRGYFSSNPNLKKLIIRQTKAHKKITGQSTSKI